MAKTTSEWEWEFLEDLEKFETWKMKVPGGWLVRTVEKNKFDNRTSSTCVFVPHDDRPYMGPR